MLEIDIMKIAIDRIQDQHQFIQWSSIRSQSTWCVIIAPVCLKGQSKCSVGTRSASNYKQTLNHRLRITKSLFRQRQKLPRSLISNTILPPRSISNTKTESVAGVGGAVFTLQVDALLQPTLWNVLHRIRQSSNRKQMGLLGLDIRGATRPHISINIYPGLA